MSRDPGPEHPDFARRSALAVAALTVVGAGLRAWPVGRLGLTHFDEGIYALAGSWVLAPGGIAAISPTLIPYAPPGFAILVGAMYAVLGGPSDLAAIAASQVVGTASIPVVAWLASRAFGPGAGVVAAALATFSGPHVAFSRMALTDGLFLLAWLLAIGAGARFLERPGAWRAVVLGLAVGLAQQCKYNGWLAGGIVAAAALLGILFRPEERPIGRWARALGWGLGAALVSSLVVWPWYRFVDLHGGYADLLRHQRSYLGGTSAWWPHLRTQFEQAIALSGGWPLRLVAWASVLILLRWTSPPPTPTPTRLRIERGETLLGITLLFLAFVNAPWWLGLAMLPGLIRSDEPARRVIGVAWLILAILTPFYHPYARLWLPLHALGWIATGGLLATLGNSPGRPESGSIRASGSIAAIRIGSRLRNGWWVGVTCLMIGVDARSTHGAHALGGLLDPSDSLRDAVAVLAARIPDEVTAVTLLARPPVTFYLGGRKLVWPQESLESLARVSDPRAWALYDAGVGSRPRSDEDLPVILRERWDVVDSAPTTLSLPTLLDIDPAAARSPDDATGARAARLWLLRPRRAGGGR